MREVDKYKNIIRNVWVCPVYTYRPAKVESIGKMVKIERIVFQIKHNPNND